MADVTEVKALLALTDALKSRSPSPQERTRLKQATQLPDALRATRDCPACGLIVERFDAAHHFAQCRHLPARRRYDVMVALARTLAGVELPEPLAALASLEFSPLDGLLSLAWGRLKPQLDGLDTRALRAAEMGEVRTALLVQLHARDRASDPCPWCGGVFEVDAFFDHLSNGAACALQRHTVVLSDALRERFGDVALEAAMEAMKRDFRPAKEALQTFLTACRTYDGEMGFEGDELYRYYSKSYAEAPWRAACDAATKWLNLEKPSPSCAPVRAVFLDVLSISSSFWSSMGEGDRGKSLIAADTCAVWQTVNAAAGRYLASFDATLAELRE